MAIYITLLYNSVSAQSPQVLRVSQIKEDSQVHEILQRNGDHFYAIIDGRDNDTRDITDDLQIDSFVFVEAIDSMYGLTIGDVATVILDYEIGNGFVDYDYTSNGDTEGYYKNDSLVAFAIVSNHCTWNGKTYSTENSPDTVFTAPTSRYIGVIDYVRDTLLFLTKPPNGYRVHVDRLTLNGDHLYVVTRTNEDTFEFMGEYFPEVIDPNWNVKYIHKINWKTGIKEWSRQFSTDIDQDYLFDIKVVEDGNLIIAKRITGRTHWDGVPIDGNSVYDGGYAFFKVSPEGELLDYIQSTCDCHGFNEIHIENDGSLLLYGAQKYVPNLILGDDSLELFSDTLFGLFGYVSSDWDNTWIKTYHGSYQNAVTGGAISHDENVLVSIAFKEEIHVEGENFSTDDSGIFTDPEDGRLENVLVVYDKDGALLKKPISIPLDAIIHKVYEVNKNHYLFFVEETYFAISILFDTVLDDYQKANFMLFEIEGELFDIVDNLDELIQPHLSKVHVYPNPARSEHTINVEGVEDWNTLESVQLISMTGNIYPINKMSKNNEGITMTLPTLPSGLYGLQMIHGKKTLQTKLVIE